MGVAAGGGGTREGRGDRKSGNTEEQEKSDGAEAQDGDVECVCVYIIGMVRKPSLRAGTRRGAGGDREAAGRSKPKGGGVWGLIEQAEVGRAARVWDGEGRNMKACVRGGRSAERKRRGGGAGGRRKAEGGRRMGTEEGGQRSN